MRDILEQNIFGTNVIWNKCYLEQLKFRTKFKIIMYFQNKSYYQFNIFLEQNLIIKYILVSNTKHISNIKIYFQNPKSFKKRERGQNQVHFGAKIDGIVSAILPINDAAPASQTSVSLSPRSSLAPVS